MRISAATFFARTEDEGNGDPLMERSIRSGKKLISGNGHFPDHCLKGRGVGACARTDCTQPY